MPKNRATRPPPVQTRAPPGAGSSSMDLDEPVDLRVEPLPSAPSRPSASSPDGEEPDMEKAKYHLAKMIALRGYDPSIIDDDCFSSFVESLNPKFRLPSRDDVETVCKTIIDTEMSISLHLSDSCVIEMTNLAVGKAKVFESEVIYMADHFIDDEWNLHQVIQKVVIINPVSFQTRADIALSMTRKMAEYKCYISGSNLFTVAWGITDDLSQLNNVLNDVLSLPRVDALKRKVLCTCTTFMDYILHSVAEHLYRNIDEEFSGYISKSALLHTSSKEQLEFLSLAGLDLWTYKEAWYSWYCLLIVEQEEGDTELVFSDLLCKIFGEIYRAIRKMSVSNGPTTNLCLVELFHVRKFLQSEISLASGGYTNLYKDCAGFVDDKDAATVLIELTEILDKAIQESYLAWSIPLVLDPRYKLGFVTTIFTEAFDQETADRYIYELSTYIQMRYSEYIINEEYEHESERQEAKKELNRYLSVDHAITEGFDILKWWKDQGSNYYKSLARMARDTLAMPTCSQLSSKQTAQLKSILRGYWSEGD